VKTAEASIFERRCQNATNLSRDFFRPEKCVNDNPPFPGKISVTNPLPLQTASSTREVKIRTAHEIMAARTTQLAFLIDQFMTTAETVAPVLAGNVRAT
jgi:hypothetical protein